MIYFLLISLIVNNLKIFFLVLIPFLIIGCDSGGGVYLNDRRGNKYTFKNESVTCTRESYRGDITCVGSAIKKDIGGSRFVTQFPKTECLNANYLRRGFLTGLSMEWEEIERFWYGELDESILCSAANQLGKINPLKLKEINRPKNR